MRKVKVSTGAIVMIAKAFFIMPITVFIGFRSLLDGVKKLTKLLIITSRVVMSVF